MATVGAVDTPPKLSPLTVMSVPDKQDETTDTYTVRKANRTLNCR